MSRSVSALTLFVAACLVLAASPARADMYGFSNITSNSVANAQAGEGQLFVDVLDAGAGRVRFDFLNEGPLASSITDLYFDDGPMLGIAWIDDSGGGVRFSENAQPRDLPGGDAIGFQTTKDFSADSDPPVQWNGVNPGESVGIIFDLLPGAGFADLIASIADGSLRIGIHVQGFANGGSESFVNGGPVGGNPPVIPAPGAALLGFVGLGTVGWVKRRFV